MGYRNWKFDLSLNISAWTVIPVEFIVIRAIGPLEAIYFRVFSWWLMWRIYHHIAKSHRNTFDMNDFGN